MKKIILLSMFVLGLQVDFIRVVASCTTETTTTRDFKNGIETSKTTTETTFNSELSALYKDTMKYIQETRTILGASFSSVMEYISKAFNRMKIEFYRMRGYKFEYVPSDSSVPESDGVKNKPVESNASIQDTGDLGSPVDQKNVPGIDDSAGAATSEDGKPAQAPRTADTRTTITRSIKNAAASVKNTATDFSNAASKQMADFYDRVIKPKSADTADQTKVQADQTKVQADQPAAAAQQDDLNLTDEQKAAIAKAEQALVDAQDELNVITRMSIRLDASDANFRKTFSGRMNKDTFTQADEALKKNNEEVTRQLEAQHTAVTEAADKLAAVKDRIATEAKAAADKRASVQDQQVKDTIANLQERKPDQWSVTKKDADEVDKAVGSREEVDEALGPRDVDAEGMQADAQWAARANSELEIAGVRDNASEDIIGQETTHAKE